MTLPGRDSLRITFRHELERVLVPLDKVCLYVLNCPGCGQSGLCPGFDVSFRKMPAAFGIELYNSKGSPVFSDLSDKRNKPLRFTPEPRERYFIAILPNKATKLGVEYDLPLTVKGFRK